MKDFVPGILKITAWRIDEPVLFGSFHITASLAAAGLAVLAAVLAARSVRDPSSHEAKLVKILSVTGWVLAVLEIYKQLFLLFIVNGGMYDWWYFPFQLCSVPMYLCMMLPAIKGGMRHTFLTFMGGYTFISALAALIYPEDILRSYAALTVHGFIWHGILLFISLLILLTGASDVSLRGLLKAAALFAVLCVIAVFINVFAEPLMQAARDAHAGIPHSYAAMFYLNPYHISPQPIVSNVQRSAGIPAGLILYALVIAAAGSIAGWLLTRFFRLFKLDARLFK